MTDFGVAAAYSGQPERLSNPAAGSAGSLASPHAQVVPLPTAAPVPVSTTPPESASPVAKWIGLAGLIAIGTSLFLMYFGTFMIGLFGLAMAVAAIGFLRATLPTASMSWFSSRNRMIDCTLYFGFALALGILALGIPQ